MAADNSRTPRYGDDDAQFRNFRQKNKPHLALAELIGDEKETMARCAVWGVQWMSEPPGPLPEENRQNYFSRKERKTEKKKTEAKAAMLKKVRERKKRPRSSSRGDPPTFQPNAATVYAPAVTFHPPEPPTTQWTMSSDVGMPSAALSRAATQGYSTPPSWAPQTSTALDPNTPPGPTSSIPDFTYHAAAAPMGALDEYSARVRYVDVSQATYATALSPSPGPGTSSGAPLSDPSNMAMVYPPTSASHALEGPTAQRAMHGDPYAPLAYVPQVANQARVTSHNGWPLPDDRPPPVAAPAAHTVPVSYHPTLGPTDELTQYAASVPYYDVHVASQGPCATAYTLSSGPDSTYAVGDPYTAQPPMLSHSEAGGGSPWMGPSSSPPGTWSESPVWDATPPLPHTAPQSDPGLTTVHDSVGGTDYASAAHQDFSRADRRPPGSPSSSTVPALAPELVEYYLNTAQMNSGYAPQAYPPTTIDDRFGVIACHGAGEQDRHDVYEVAQAVYPPQDGHSVGWVPSAVAPHIDCERSDDIGGAANSTYAYDQDVQVQPEHHPAPPTTTSNFNAYPPQQSSYSELSQALEYPAHPCMHECTPLNMEHLATSPTWSTVSPAVNVGSYVHLPGSSFGAGSMVALPLAPPYTQGVVINQVQSDTSTHLWPPSAYAPQYSHVDYLPVSIPTVSSSKTTVEANYLTHIDSEWSAIHYGHSGAA